MDNLKVSFETKIDFNGEVKLLKTEKEFDLDNNPIGMQRLKESYFQNTCDEHQYSVAKEVKLLSENCDEVTAENLVFGEFLKTVSRMGIKHCIISEQLARKFLNYFKYVQGMAETEVENSEINDGAKLGVYSVTYEYKKDYDK